MTTAQQAREALERIIDDSETPPLEVDIRVIRAFIDSAEAAQKDAREFSSDERYWVSIRTKVIAALQQQGLTIVTTAHGVHLLKLGKIEAQSEADAAMKPAGEKT